MATTVSYSASMRTRKTTSSSKAKTSTACQEYYDSSYNYVGIVNFSGMALSGKVITGISLTVTSEKSGYGTGHTKTVYVRKSNYQSASQSGITGGNYYGDALGTFTGTFYGNTTSYTLSGTLLDNLAAYFSAGNNTICLFNPSPTATSYGYSQNYLQWSECTITITYEEAASKPSLSKSTFDMGTAVTVYQTLNTSVAGSAQVGDSLGTLTGKFYNNTTTHTLSSSSNSAFFSALCSYLTAGNSALVLYNGETSSSSSYSTNYARITSISITVQYENATVYYRTGGAWVQCAVYYRLNGAWVRVAPYYRTGGAWIQV